MKWIILRFRDNLVQLIWHKSSWLHFYVAEVYRKKVYRIVESQKKSVVGKEYSVLIPYYQPGNLSTNKALRMTVGMIR